MLATLDELRDRIGEGEVIGYTLVTLERDGTARHSRNLATKDIERMIGLLEMTKLELLRTLDID